MFGIKNFHVTKCDVTAFESTRSPAGKTHQKAQKIKSTKYNLLCHIND